MHNDNWDDLRFVLAVAETGSVSAAARTLGVNHATVLRRVAAFEETHGTDIFERSQQGYRLRPDRAHVIEAAREASQAMRRVAHLLRSDGLGHGEILRVTSTNTFCTTVLADGAGELEQALSPHRLSLISSNAHLDMARLQADVAVRPAMSVPSDMQGEHAADLGFAVYARDEGEDRWLGLAGALHRSAPARWLAETVPPQEIGNSADSFVALCRMAEARQGAAILPCILGDDTPTLRRVERGFPDMTVPIWVLCHRDLAGAARLRRCIGAIAGLLGSRAARLRGSAA